MLKRLLIIGTLCIGLMALGGTDAHAWPASSSGWGATQNTVTVWSGWKGISNVDLKPTTVRVTLDCVVVQAQCINNGGNDGGLGNPFLIPIPLEGSQTSPNKASKNGRWQSTITFQDEDILGGLKLSDLECINPNWTAVSFVVKSFKVFISAFENINDICENAGGSLSDQCYTSCTYDSVTDTTTCKPPYDLEEVVHIQGSCDLGSAPINVGSAYTCGTDFQWEYSRRSQTCTDPAQSDYYCIYPW